MRYSVDEADQGYRNYTKARPCRVLIDGVERKHVITADEDERKALVQVLDADGRPKLNDERTEVLTEWVYGAVCVLPAPHPAPN